MPSESQTIGSVVQLRKKRNVLPWSEKQENFLFFLGSRLRLSAKKIFKTQIFSRRSLASITWKMSSLELGDPEVRRRAKNVKRLTPDERKELREFLSGEGRHLACDDAVHGFPSKLKISKPMILYYRKKWGIELNSKESFSSKLFKDRHKHVLSALQKGLRKHFDNFWSVRRKQLSMLANRQTRSGNVAVYKICKGCGEQWPALEEFFYLNRVLQDGTVRLYNYCKACGLPWIRKRHLRRKNKEAK